MKLDPAVLELLKLDAQKTTVSSGAGGGCSSASSWQIKTQLADGTYRRFFMKTATGDAGRVMVEGEHASLTAIHSIVPTLVPQPHGWGTLTTSPSTHFLVVDYLDSSSSSSSSSSNPTPHSLASKLATLHTTPTPTPPSHPRPVFGFPLPTCCGDTPQENSYKASWADFFATNRLSFILRRAEDANGPDGELRTLVTRTIARVVPRLLGDGHLNGGRGVVPVVVHGDLWGGNVGRGRVDGGVEVEEVIFDPAASYAHSEFELGIMRMFGGFGKGFYEEYHGLCPRGEPVGEFEDRVGVYEL
ncbi:hypothetical protein FQN52_007294 [Onygenales sp. PD_12]|nr:hypothetical protein FQN52_007294 [Onygenales sp. PD_12]